jgi:hypothetical protein
MPKLKRCAIVGYTQHQLYAPWNNPEWEIWGLNDLYEVMPQYNDHLLKGETWDRVQWFQVHRNDHGEIPDGARDPKHGEWLKNAKCPIWMFEPLKDVPNAVRYPIEDVLRLFPRAYFNNTISWMIAKALLDGYEEIGIWGVDMALDGVHGQSEYSHQRPSVEYFVGWADGHGVKFYIPTESEICKCGFLYGKDNITPTRRKLTDRLSQLKQQEAETVAVYEGTKKDLFACKGALHAMRNLALDKIADDAKQAWIEQGQKFETTEEQLQQQLEDTKRSLHEIRGAIHNTEWLLTNYLPGDGPLQDLKRFPNAVTYAEVGLPQPVASDVAKSDGQGPANRVALLESLHAD